MTAFKICVCFVVAVAIGCDSDGDGESAVQGIVTAPWDAYCVATFTEDYTVFDVFDDPLFTAREGEAYLIKDHGDRFGELRTEMYYIAPNGAVDFEVNPKEDGGLVFTSNCDLNDQDKTRLQRGVFDDFAVFVDEALTEKACDLITGTVFDGSISTRLISNEGNSFTNITGFYVVEAPGLAEFCNGHEKVYVKVDSRYILGVSHTFVPILSFMIESNSTP